MIKQLFPNRIKDECDLPTQCGSTRLRPPEVGLSGDSKKMLAVSDRNIAAQAILHEDMTLVRTLTMLVSFTGLLLAAGAWLISSSQGHAFFGCYQIGFGAFSLSMSLLLRDSINERLTCLTQHKADFVALDVFLRGHGETTVFNAKPEKKIYRYLPTSLSCFWAAVSMHGLLLSWPAIVACIS